MNNEFIALLESDDISWSSFYEAYMNKYHPTDDRAYARLDDLLGCIYAMREQLDRMREGY